MGGGLLRYTPSSPLAASFCRPGCEAFVYSTRLLRLQSRCFSISGRPFVPRGSSTPQPFLLSWPRRAKQPSSSTNNSEISARIRWTASPLASSTIITSLSGASLSSALRTRCMILIGQSLCCSEGGYFNAIMSFPTNYPNSPPTVRFISEMWHPNVYPDGRVCISILHAPGEDPNGYELASERWSPVHTVESIVLSIISMLSSPNDESPANIEAAKEWRERRDEFKKKVSRIVRRSQEML
ncbi:ubiquitin-conjugating enzyme E2 7-like isoform X1 [Phoenix dactylifera]|uniref:Ubiquitin-conjugating enzyme E2 7-like isoform X1 n=1 Tax=Phoenix dactylifera TaxID=42345 RepID=A0A8B7MT83_PHODC|nr:ubiquitin-conjugating enzyme E2 7-like isoform X1 [Phoenix dactylifera]